MPTDNNDDRPHYHIHDQFPADTDNFATILLFSCHVNDTCDIHDPVVVVSLDDYRALVAAARDRHPTNQQRGTDPTSRTDDWWNRDWWHPRPDHAADS